MLSHQNGKQTEDAAAKLYQNSGYKILARNYRYYGQGRGQKAEIDIIAQRGKLLIVIEVKFRAPNSSISSIESITPRKLILMQLAIQAFLQASPKFRDCLIRFYAVVSDGQTLSILENISL